MFPAKIPTESQIISVDTIWPLKHGKVKRKLAENGLFCRSFSGNGNILKNSVTDEHNL